jgi:hypothetical protein
MERSEDVQAALVQAIERTQIALWLVGKEAYPTSAYLIGRALDQMRADVGPNAIEGAPPSH